MPAHLLIPALEVHICTSGAVPGAAAQRFCAVFARTWDQLPRRVRRWLSAWWFGGRYKTTAPRVYLCERLPGWLQRGRPDGDVFGACIPGGDALFLHAGSCTALPDDFLMALQAHEVCHVYFYARGRARKPPERRVDVAVECWGYRMADLRAGEVAGGVRRDRWLTRSGFLASPGASREL